ncbi:cytochrome P450 [Chaetomium tenue]|uniref:Cytochrome P450 n=1 Tax=Chaetomium tenue TaxID=1854479 RepID=A0ACB7PK10_9PEZI|nr:cytochrome P450 [Chaetomium globosum]
MIEEISHLRELLGSLQGIVATPGKAVLAATAICSLIAAIHVFRAWWRLRHIPGPFLNSITPLAMTYHCFTEDVTTYTYNLTRKYGPLVRVQPNVVVYNDPETLRRICSVKADYTKGLWFEFSRWNLERYSCIAMRDNESRKERKTKLLPAASRVDNQFYTLDVATSATFGKPFGFLKKDGDVEKYLETTEAMTPMFGVLGTLPWLVYVMHAWPLNRMMPGEGDQVGFGRMMNVAGSETTSIALRMALLSILTTPLTYRKLQAEIDNFHANKAVEADDKSVMTYADAKTLPYLQAVIREALRLWPPSAGLFTKEVPKAGDSIHGYYLPPGTEVGQCLSSVGKLPRIWGADADLYYPERWLEATPEKFDEMQAAVDLVFSSGKYVCLGKHIAWMELLKFFAEVTADPITWLTTDFWIRFTRRE